MIISFSGIDGAGKTTQAQYVTKLLQHKKQQVQYMHMIRWTLVNRLGRLLQSRNKKTHKNDNRQSRNKQFALIRGGVSLLDVLGFRMLTLYQINVRHQIIVCDRFFYDLGVQALYIGAMSPRIENFYWQIVPTPTIPILLDVPPEIAQQREAEHNLSYYQRKRELYLERVPRWGATVVDAIEREKTQQDIKQILYTCLDNIYA